MRIERLVTAHSLEVEWHHFPLHPETPPEGLALEDLFKGRGFNLDQMLDRLKQVADQQGLPWGRRTHTYNSRLAQELGAWADQHRPGSTIHDALFRAYFVDGLNLHQQDVLLTVAESVGLPVDQAERVITERSCREEVDRQWRESRQMGVTAVPTFAIGRLAVVGAQPYEALEQLVVAASKEI